MDDPDVQEVMPLDRMESQIRLLLESMGEVEDLVEGLTRRVKALEEAQSMAQPEAESPARVKRGAGDGAMWGSRTGCRGGKPPTGRDRDGRHGGVTA